MRPAAAPAVHEGRSGGPAGDARPAGRGPRGRIRSGTGPRGTALDPASGPGRRGTDPGTAGRRRAADDGSRGGGPPDGAAGTRRVGTGACGAGRGALTGSAPASTMSTLSQGIEPVADLHEPAVAALAVCGDPGLHHQVVAEQVALGVQGEEQQRVEAEVLRDRGVLVQPLVAAVGLVAGQGAGLRAPVVGDGEGVPVPRSCRVPSSRESIQSAMLQPSSDRYWSRICQSLSSGTGWCPCRHRPRRRCRPCHRPCRPRRRPCRPRRRRGALPGLRLGVGLGDRVPSGASAAQAARRENKATKRFMGSPGGSGPGG